MVYNKKLKSDVRKRLLTYIKCLTAIGITILIIFAFCHRQRPAQPAFAFSGKQGIDVSEWNGEIDWEKVKASGIDFAIIRCGYGSAETGREDKYWRRNASECERLGIPYGVYIYSYALNEEEALKEAKFAAKLIKRRNLSMPVFYDVEEDCHLALSEEKIAAICESFCTEIKSRGYVPGVYSGEWIWKNLMTDEYFTGRNICKWVASYGAGEPIIYDIWQYSQSGRIAGISENVDLNLGK